MHDVKMANETRQVKDHGNGAIAQNSRPGNAFHLSEVGFQAFNDHLLLS